eukprot:4226601-Amphidinium_carterae.1
MNVCPVLYKALVLVITRWHGDPNEHGIFDPFIVLHALDMQSGVPVWRKKMSKWIGVDASSLFVEDDVGVFAIRSKPPNLTAGESVGEGQNAVLGVNLSTQDELWTYDLGGDIVWNFMPSSAGDGSIVFSGPCGTAYR